ncbi:MAG: hypothetical protein J2P25_03910 [Nocardiopsaceae bacterium]|nr:hypothetical protein [Nocardiopsaceae bacterium]
MAALPREDDPSGARPGSVPRSSGARITSGSGPALPSRAMLIAGGAAAIAAAAVGLAVLVTLSLIGWITAPHDGFGGGLGGVLRDAGLLWLVAHHVEVTVRGVGQIGLLPLGLVLLPGALLERAGRWLTREGHVTRLRHVSYAALAIACPYALFTAAVALGVGTETARPSLVQAVAWGFLLALVASGLGAAHGLAPWRKLAGLLSPRPRSVALGAVAALGVVTALGALLNAVSLGLHLSAYQSAVDSLGPGPFGSALLLLAELAYLPNSVIWAIAYTLGPGFAFGAGTAVSPSGSALGALPAFPMLAALPTGSGPAFPAWLGFFVLATPYLAGALAGIVAIRVAPTPFSEAAPLWGLLTGSLAGAVLGLLAWVSGGPLGSGRLASVGPNGAEAGLVAVLEVGVTAALVAGAANWLLLRHHIKRLDWPPAPARDQFGKAQPKPGAPVPAPVVDEADDAGGHRIYVDPWGDSPEAG